MELGFWVGIGSLVVGVVAILITYVLWRHPRRSRLLTDITVSRIGVPKEYRVHVAYDGSTLDDPMLIRVKTAVAAGPEIPRIGLGDIVFSPNGTGKIAAILGGKDDDISVNETSGVVAIEPRIFKYGEVLDVTLLCDGNPDLRPEVRIANVIHVTTQATAKKNRRTARILSNHCVLQYACGAWGLDMGKSIPREALISLILGGLLGAQRASA